MKKLLLTLLLASAAVTHAATAPTLIPFQGRLTDQAGTAYTNGQFTLIFNLYDQAVGGNVLWTETHQKVGVVNGMVNVFLGSINPALVTVDFSQTRHLGITIDADNNPNTPDPEMVPRQMIIPAFWAQNTSKLAGYDWSSLLASGNNPATGLLRGDKLANASVTSNQIATSTISLSNLSPTLISQLTDSAAPVASVQAYMGVAEPTGWLLCDGRVVDRTTYARLFAVLGTSCGPGTNATTFHLPDLRGMFLRGFNGNRSDAYADPDRLSRTNLVAGGAFGNALGSIQFDELKSHAHALNSTEQNQGQGAAVYGSGSPLSNLTAKPTGGNESRPKNFYVNYIVKY